MANPFAITPASPLQALLMGQKGFDQGRKAMQDAALAEAGQLYAAGDIKGAQAVAARGGSLAALMGFGQQANNERDFKFRESEAARAQENANRSFGLQERQIGATAANTAASRELARAQFEFQKEQGNRPELREVTDAHGNKSLVLVDRKNPSNVQPINVPGQSTGPGNPFLTSGPMKDEESKAALYANRMINAERVFSDPKVLSAAQSPVQRGIDKMPILGSSGMTGAGNFIQSADYQRFDQAKRDFINAVLRRESGAVIADSEFANAERQYFPQPGDSEVVLKQKAANRIEAIKGIGAAAGRNYRPPAIAGSASPQSAGVPPLPPGFQLVQ